MNINKYYLGGFMDIVFYIYSFKIITVWILVFLLKYKLFPFFYLFKGIILLFVSILGFFFQTECCEFIENTFFLYKINI